MTAAPYEADHTALLIVDPYNDFMTTAAFDEAGRQAAHEVNRPRFAHAIPTT
jgi:hypothetical protein